MKQPCKNVRNVLFSKKIKSTDESYVLSADHSIQHRASVIPTAMVRIICNGVVFGPIRAMLDTGAQPNLMSYGLYKQLELPVQSAANRLVGIDGKPFIIKHKVMVEICSWFDANTCIKDIFWILPKHDDWQPLIPSRELNIVPDMKQFERPLADPEYTTPQPVQMLLGTGFFARILISVVDRNIDGTVWLETELGMVNFDAQSDKSDMEERSVNLAINYVENEQLDQLLCRLWEMDQIPACSNRTKEQESFC